MMNRENDVILAVLKLSRAMRRCPPDPAEHPFPPAVGRLMECIAANPGVSSRDLCEMLDLRPSSLSEMLARAESDGLAVRTVNEEDRRLQRVNLSEKGRALVTRMQEAREADIAKKTACFTDEEKAQFCSLCNRLSEHMESLAADIPDYMRRPPRHHGPFPPHEGPEEYGDAPDSPPEPPRPGRLRLPPNAKIRC